MVKQFHGVSGLACATALISPLVMVSAAVASPMTQVTDVQLTQKAGGLDVVLQTQGGGKPQVFNVNNKDNSFTSFVFNAKVAKAFRKDNPAPGIAYVSVTPSGSNGVEVKVAGNGAAPTGQVVRKDATGITLSVMGNIAPAGRVGQAMTAQTGAIAQAVNIAQAATPVAPLSPSPVINSVPPSAPSAPVPPLQPRPVAPPVGDMSVGQIDTSAPSVDLGSAERIPRLVLRDAPVREVLSLLARAAGMNLAFAEAPGAAGGGAPGGPGGGSSGGPTISLDIENESVQDVFNYVLRIACVPAVGGSGGGGSQCASLEANRVGRTIFVGPRLPDDARNTISRTIRLNQAAAANAASFLTTQGAETQRAIEQISLTTVGEGAAARTVETRTPTILALRANEGVGPLVLRGLSVATDDRLNSITLTGTPRKVDMATALLTQLDARRRQATVSVKVVDINLNAINRSGTSFSFGINDTQVVQQGGAAVINLGSNAPAGFAGPADGVIGAGSPTTSGTRGLFGVGNRWLAQLQATIDSDNAKILTDPTLVVQEGQRAQVKLVEEVATNFKVETQTSTGGAATQTVTIEKQEAGLQLDLDLDRIDDNGFISLRVVPKISSPARVTSVNLNGNINTFTLLQKREVSSGLVRIRDGQTLVLTGVIQDTDRASVSKVPILGDLPLLGALFRRTTNTNDRREVVVLVTPRIMDDTDRSTYGYGYNPSSDAQKLIQKN
jgi:type IV pilus assembly protein PilQ